MKVVIMFLMALALSSVIKLSAQSFVLKNPNNLALDTVSNTVAEGPSARVPGKATDVGFGLEITKISGTVAGKVYLQGATADGKWVMPAVDSITLFDRTENYGFQKNLNGYQYYRLLISGTGTMSASYKATGYIRQ